MPTNHPTRATCTALVLLFASVSLVDCDEDGSLQATAPLTAVPTMKNSAAATIVLGTSACGVIDSNANCVATPFRAVVTSSAPGIEIERYFADGVFNDTGHAVVFTFADFGPPFGYCVSEVTGALSADWVETLLASGRASIVCRFRG